jgi:hypothetical protein
MPVKQLGGEKGIYMLIEVSIFNFIYMEAAQKRSKNPKKQILHMRAYTHIYTHMHTYTYTHIQRCIVYKTLELRKGVWRSGENKL